MTSTTKSSKKDILKLIDPIVDNVFNDKIVYDKSNISQQLALRSKDVTEVMKDVEASTSAINDVLKMKSDNVDYLTINDVESIYNQIQRDNYEFSNMFNDLSRDLTLSKASYNKVYTRYIPNINRAIYNLRVAQTPAQPLDKVAAVMSTYDVRSPTKGSYSDKFLNTSIWGAKFTVKTVAVAGGKIIANVAFTTVLSTFGATPATVGLVTGWFVIGVADTLSKNSKNPLTDDYDKRLVSIMSGSIGFMTINMPYFIQLPGVAGPSIASYARITILAPVITNLGKKLVPMTFKGLFVSNTEEDMAIKTIFDEADKFDVTGLFESLMVVQQEDNFRNTTLGRSTAIFGIAALVPKRAKIYVDYVTERVAGECVDSLLETSKLSFMQQDNFLRERYNNLMNRSKIPLMRPIRFLANICSLPIKTALMPVTLVWNLCMAGVNALAGVLKWVNKKFGYATAMLLAVVVVPLMVLNLDAQYDTLIGNTVVGLFGAAVEATYNIVFTKDFLMETFRTTAVPEITARFASPALYSGFEAIVGSFAVSGALYGIDVAAGGNVFSEAMIVVLTLCPVFIAVLNRSGATDWLEKLPGGVGAAVKMTRKQSARIYGKGTELTNILQEEVGSMMYALGIVDRINQLERWNGAKIECARWTLMEWTKVVAIEGVMIGKMNEQITDLFSLGVDKGMDYYNDVDSTDGFSMTYSEVEDSIIEANQKITDTGVGIEANKLKTEAIKKEINENTEELKSIYAQMAEDPDPALKDRASYFTGELERKKGQLKEASVDRVRMEKDQKFARLTKDVLTEKLEDGGETIQFDPLYRRRSWGNQTFNMWLDVHSWWRKESNTSEVLSLYKKAVDDINNSDKSREIEGLLFDLEELQMGEDGLKLSAESLEELIFNWDKDKAADARRTAEEQYPKATSDEIDKYCTSNFSAGCASYEGIAEEFYKRKDEIVSKTKSLDDAVGSVNNDGFVTGLGKIRYYAESVINQSTDLNRSERQARGKELQNLATTGLMVSQADSAVVAAKRKYGSGGELGVIDLEILMNEKRRELEQERVDGIKVDSLNKELLDIEKEIIRLEFQMGDDRSLNKIEGLDRYARMSIKNMGNFLKQKNMEYVMALRSYYRDGSAQVDKGTGIIWFPTDLDDIGNNFHGFLSMTPTEVVGFTALGLVAGSGGVIPFSTVFFLAVNRYLSQVGFGPSLMTLGYEVRGIDIMTKLGPALRSAKSLVIDVIMRKTKSSWQWVTELFYGQTTEITQEQKDLIETEFRKLKNRLFTIAQTKKKLGDIYDAQMKKLDERDDLTEDDRAQLKALFEQQRLVAEVQFEQDVKRATGDYAGVVMVVTPYVEQIRGRSGRPQAEVAVDHATSVAISIQTEIDIILDLGIDVDVDTAVAYSYGGDDDADDLELTNKRSFRPQPTPQIDTTVDSNRRVFVNGAVGVKWDDTKMKNALIPKDVQDILKEYIDNEDDPGKKAWMKTNYLWAGMYQSSYNELKEIDVDPDMLISMFRKAQFASLQDMALNVEGYGSVMEYEREAEERFYKAIAVDESDQSFWNSGGKWIDGQWRSDGTGRSESTKVAREEVTMPFKTYDDKTLEELEAEGRYVPQPEYDIGGYKVGGGDGYVRNREFDKFGLGSGDAVRLTDHRFLDMINLDKETSEHFTTVSDFYKALKADPTSDRVKVNWGNRVLLELLSDETPGVSVEYLTYARSDEVDVRNWDSTRQIDATADKIGMGIEKWRGVDVIEDDLTSIMSPFTDEVGKSLWTDRGGGAWEGATFLRDYVVGQNELAMEIGENNLADSVLKGVAKGASVGGVVGVIAAERYGAGAPFVDLVGFVSGGILGGSGGALAAGGSALGFTSGGGPNWNNGLQSNGDTWEEAHFSEVYAVERYPPFDPTRKKAGSDLYVFGSFLNHPLSPDFKQNQERRKLATGMDVLADQYGIRLGSAPLGKRGDFGGEADVQLTASSAIERRKAVDDFARLENYMLSDEVISRAGIPETERTEKDMAWFARYKIANDMYNSIKTRDALVNNFYRRNEAWEKYPELVIDESFVHTPRNQVANFLGAFHYKNFIRKDLMRSDLLVPSIL